MRKIVLLGAGFAMAMPLAADAQRRETGAHQHGHGTLNIAVEGNRVILELDVPGADIVGFEHAATTKVQRAAIEKAKAQLAAPLTLFAFPAAAGCRVQEANVEIEGAEEVKAGPSGTKPREPGRERQHSDFKAGYRLDCTSIDKVTAIEFPYFRVFSAAEELEVSIITPKGQSKFEVKRSKPRIDLAGVM